MFSIKLVSVLAMVGTLCVCVENASFEEDTRITGPQAEILEKFRDRVRSKLPHKYMEESIFLVRYLRSRNFDINRAEEMLLKNLNWRKEQRIDSIDNENWRDFENDFPLNQNGVDKTGRPMVQILLREWDIRSAAISGRRDRLARWIYKYFEDATKKVRVLQGQGQNVTQWNLILDAEGFNPITHGCPLCMPIYLIIANAYEEYFPGSIHKIQVVNTPEFFNVVIRLVWPLLSQQTRQSLKIHGTNKPAWRKILSDEIDDSQLLHSFGGTFGNDI